MLSDGGASIGFPGCAGVLDDGGATTDGDVDPIDGGIINGGNDTAGGGAVVGGGFVAGGIAGGRGDQGV